MLDIAVVGATGVVGQTLLQILESSKFPFNKLYCIASHRSKGTIINFRNQEYSVESLDEFDFNQVDLVFGCVGSKPSQEFIPRLPKHVILIDEASFLRRDFLIPLVIPEVNPEQVIEFRNKNIIASPNCCAVPIVIALNELKALGDIKRVVVSTYQSCSGAGKAAVDELLTNTRNQIQNENFASGNFLKNNYMQDHAALPDDISFNVIPVIGKFDYYEDNKYDTDEEIKVRDEINKIMNCNIDISVTAVRVPVLVGHSFSLNIEFEQDVDLDLVVNTLKSSKNISYSEKCLTPKGIIGDRIFNPDEMWRNMIHVSRLRHSVSRNKKVLDMWIVANNLTKGAALNLFQIAEELVKHF